MAVRRPGIVTAAAVLCIVYGSLGLLVGLCGVIGLILQGSLLGGMAGQKEMMEQMLGLPGYQIFNISSTFIILLESAGMLIAGIGLLSMSGWAKTLGLVSTFVGIARTIITAVYVIAVVMPATPRMVQVFPPGPQREAAELGGRIGGIVQIVFYVAVLIYLVVTLILLFRCPMQGRPEPYYRGEGGGEGEWPRREERRSDGYEDEGGWQPRNPNPVDPRDRDKYRSE